MRSFRRNLASSRPPPHSSSAHQDGGAKDGRGQNKGAFVKINMDGVPIGRKVDLAAYGGYSELSAAVGKLFRGLLAGTSVTSAHHPSPAFKNGVPASSLHTKKIVIAQPRGTRPLQAATGRRRCR